MKKFTAYMNYGPVEFLGNDWEEGGFCTDDANCPARDHLGNRVQKWAVDDVTADDCQLLETTFTGGDSTIEEVGYFKRFLKNEANLGEAEIAEVCLRLGL